MNKLSKLIVIFIVCLISISCKTVTKTVEVPVETIKKEYIYNEKVDTTIIRDSIDRFIKGDTVYVYKSKYRYKYISKVDTLVKTDTIPKIIKVTETKEVKTNYIYWYQKFFMWLGVLFLCFIMWYIIRKKVFK